MLDTPANIAAATFRVRRKALWPPVTRALPRGRVLTSVPIFPSVMSRMLREASSALLTAFAILRTNQRADMAVEIGCVDDPSAGALCRLGHRDHRPDTDQSGRRPKAQPFAAFLSALGLLSPVAYLERF